MIETIFDKNVDAEYSLIGAVCIDSRILEKIQGKVSANDFTIPYCSQLYEIAVGAVNAGENFDAVIAADALAQIVTADEARKFVMDCMDLCPSCTQAEAHAAIVRRYADTRRLKQSIDTAIDSTDEPQELAGSLISLCHDYLQGKTSKRLKTLQDAVLEMYDGKARTAKVNRVDTGFPRLDGILKGIWGGNLCLIGARPGVGKDQPLYSKVLTPVGWKHMGEIKIGDSVIGSDGKPYNVVDVIPQGKRDVYRIHFNDETYADCGKNHLWETRTRKERKNKYAPSVKTTKEIMKTLTVCADNRHNHSVRYVEPVEFEKKKLPIDPYALGLLIGDGSLSHTSVGFTNIEGDVINKLSDAISELDELRNTDGKNYKVCREKRNNKPSVTRDALKKLGLFGLRSHEKFIPNIYLLSCVEDRLLLLRGLIDTDGYVAHRNSIEYSTTSRKLAEDVRELVLSLGGRCTVDSRGGYYTKNGVCHKAKRNFRVNISFANNIIPVSSQKHLAKYRTCQRPLEKFITDVTYIGKFETQCITVDSADGLYVTDNYILTHNSAFALDIARTAAIRGQRVLIYSFEMMADELAERMIAHASNIELDKLIENDMTDDEWKEVVGAGFKLSKLPIVINDDTRTTVNDIRTQARLFPDLKLIIVDFITLMPSTRKFDNRNLEVGALSRELKNLASELNIPIIAIAQLNRGMDETQEPTLRSLRDSGELEQNANKVLLMWNTDKGNNEVGVFVAKNRRGKTGTVRMRFTGEYMSYMELSDDYIPISKKRKSKGYDDVFGED